MDRDIDLIERYRKNGDQAAFASLFERHSGMVYATCLRVLRLGHPGLEDACQATFIILAQKAHLLRNGQALAGWLHVVAHSAAIGILRSETRRRAHESTSPPPPPQKDTVDQEALREHLDSALIRLSAAQREVVLRHVMEQKPQAIVAAELGISEGAVKKRVADAIAKLRDYFTRRGVTATSAMVLAAMSFEAQASSAVPSVISDVAQIGSFVPNSHQREIAQKVLKNLPNKTWSLLSLGMVIATLGTVLVIASETILRTIPSRPTAPAMNSVGESTLKECAPDVYGSVGYARGHWASSIGKMLVFLSSSPEESPSIRAYDPVSDRWEHLWQQDPAQNYARGDYASFYIPRLDELWIWNGDYDHTFGKAFASARFQVSDKKWSALGETDSEAFVGVVDFSATNGMPFSGTDPAMAWAEKADIGLMLGGTDDSGELTFIFEPKVGGPEQYRSTCLKIPRPPSRTQCMNAMVSDGTDFYLIGGSYRDEVTPNWSSRKDLWKFTTSTRTWSELPAPWESQLFPVLTYDSDLHALVTWTENKIFVFDIAAATWSERTPSNLRKISNQIGVYSPTAKMHLFEGGNDRDLDGGAVYSLYGLKLSARKK